MRVGKSKAYQEAYLDGVFPGEPDLACSNVGGCTLTLVEMHSRG
jgi:hypothetical protein